MANIVIHIQHHVNSIDDHVILICLSFVIITNNRFPWKTVYRVGIIIPIMISPDIVCPDCAVPPVENVM